jgi:ketosteroid isomerase-like protein
MTVDYGEMAFLALSVIGIMISTSDSVMYSLSPRYLNTGAMSSDRPVSNSIESIRESYIAQFADTTILARTCSLRIENVEVSASGDLGYSRSTENLSINKPGGIIENTINRVNIWKKINGEWKCLINIWNNNPSENR